MVPEHDFHQPVRSRKLFKQPPALLCQLTSLHLDYLAFLYLPPHRRQQSASYALNATDKDFTVGLTFSVEYTTAPSWKVAASGRIAGTKLHPIQALPIVGSR